MKLLSISGVTMLFSILAPVNSMAINSSPELIPVPHHSQAFSYLCQNSRRHHKNVIEQRAQIGKQALDYRCSNNGYPLRLSTLNYSIDGVKWYYPIDDDDVDFVIFTRAGHIAGVAYLATNEYQQQYLSPCQLEV
ncbi:Bgt-50457, partial [Blumeria graminis f. sp. tritici]